MITNLCVRSKLTHEAICLLYRYRNCNIDLNNRNVTFFQQKHCDGTIQQHKSLKIHLEAYSVGIILLTMLIFP